MSISVEFLLGDEICMCQLCCLDIKLSLRISGYVEKDGYDLDYENNLCLKCLKDIVSKIESVPFFVGFEKDYFDQQEALELIKQEKS
jgi:hypothetical protein